MLEVKKLSDGKWVVKTMGVAYKSFVFTELGKFETKSEAERVCCLDLGIEPRKKYAEYEGKTGIRLYREAVENFKRTHEVL